MKPIGEKERLARSGKSQLEINDTFNKDKITAQRIRYGQSRSGESEAIKILMQKIVC